MPLRGMRGILAGATALIAIAGVAVGVRAMCGHCGVGDEGSGKAAHAHKGMPAAQHAMTCPSLIEGAEVKVTETEKGVLIEITAQEPKAIKEIQTAAAHMTMKGECPHCSVKDKPGAKGAKPGLQKSYTCGMKGCYTGPKTKDGRCPNCGMELKEAK